MKFKKFGCGCIGFITEGGDIVVVDDCSRGTYEPQYCLTFMEGKSYIRPENIRDATYLSDEENAEFLKRFRRQLLDGWRYQEIKRLLAH
jgi:hypothetical protein